MSNVSTISQFNSIIPLINTMLQNEAVENENVSPIKKLLTDEITKLKLRNDEIVKKQEEALKSCCAIKSKKKGLRCMGLLIVFAGIASTASATTSIAATLTQDTPESTFTRVSVISTGFFSGLSAISYTIYQVFSEYFSYQTEQEQSLIDANHENLKNARKLLKFYKDWIALNAKTKTITIEKRMEKFQDCINMYHALPEELKHKLPEPERIVSKLILNGLPSEHPLIQKMHILDKYSSDLQKNKGIVSTKTYIIQEIKNVSPAPSTFVPLNMTNQTDNALKNLTIITPQLPEHQTTIPSSSTTISTESNDIKGRSPLYEEQKTTDWKSEEIAHASVDREPLNYTLTEVDFLKKFAELQICLKELGVKFPLPYIVYNNVKIYNNGKRENYNSDHFIIDIKENKIN